MILEHLNEPVRHTLDAAALVLTIGAIANVLPKVAALFSIIWLAIQIFDRLKHGPRRKAE